MSTPDRSAVRRLATARFVSLTGSGAAFTALAYIIFQRTNQSTVWVSVALLATFGAQGVFTPLGGALGDRYDRRMILVASDLLAAGGFVALALVASPALMVAFAFLTAALEAPFWSVSAAAIPNFVDAEDLPWANGTMAVGRNIGFLIGPILGGALVALFAGDSSEAQLRLAGYWIYGLNAFSFVGSALLVRSIRRSFSGDRTDAEEHRGLRAGVVFLLHDRVLRTITLAWVVLLLGAGFTLVAEIPLAESFGAGSLGYGMLSASWGGGAALGSLLGRRLLSAAREPGGLVAGTVVVGVGLGLVSVAPWFVLALALTLAGGAGEGLSGVAEQGIIQRRTPDAVRARVIGASEAAVLIAFAVSFGFGGFLVGAVGARVAYAIAGGSCLVAAGILLPVLTQMSGARTGGLSPSLNRTARS